MTLAILLAQLAMMAPPPAAPTADRIRQIQYQRAVESRAQHREIERVQPPSRLEPEIEADQRRRQAEKLVIPGKK